MDGGLGRARGAQSIDRVVHRNVEYKVDFLSPLGCFSLAPTFACGGFLVVRFAIVGSSGPSFPFLVRQWDRPERMRGGEEQARKT